jgi:hypothetical protein
LQRAFFRRFAPPESRFPGHAPRFAVHESPITTHQSRLTNHAFLIASGQILKIALTRSQQTRKHFLIASLSAISALAPRLSNHDSRIAPFLFDTNKPHKTIILMRALLKTKEKQFSIPYKFDHRGTGSPAAAGTLGCALRFWVRALRHPHQNKCAQARLPMPPVPRGTNHQSLLTNHQSRLSTRMRLAWLCR